MGIPSSPPKESPSCLKTNSSNSAPRSPKTTTSTASEKPFTDSASETTSQVSPRPPQPSSNSYQPPPALGTLFNSDVGDVPSANLYGSHPLYLDTRYFSQLTSGALTYTAHPTDRSAQYRSYTHGVYLRNVHAQEVLLRPSGLTWRAIGGTIDLYVYAGPSATDVIAAYQRSAAGLPAMQQYWTLGYHQCRWGYGNWTVLQGVVDGFERAGIPLETVWGEYLPTYLGWCCWDWGGC